MIVKQLNTKYLVAITKCRSPNRVWPPHLVFISKLRMLLSAFQTWGDARVYRRFILPGAVSRFILWIHWSFTWSTHSRATIPQRHLSNPTSLPSHRGFLLSINRSLCPGELSLALILRCRFVCGKQSTVLTSKPTSPLLLLQSQNFCLFSFQPQTLEIKRNNLQFQP